MEGCILMHMTGGLGPRPGVLFGIAPDVTGIVLNFYIVLGVRLPECRVEKQKRQRFPLSKRVASQRAYIAILSASWLILLDLVVSMSSWLPCKV